MSVHELRFESTLGEVLVRGDGQAVTGLWFFGQKHAPAPIANARRSDWIRGVADCLNQLLTNREANTPPLSPQGTPFQRRVWNALLDIPSAHTISYGALATAIGAPASVRAVAAAVGRNPISVWIPCHRVIGSNGSLTGYAGGLGRKRALLALEAGRDLPWRTVSRAYRTQYPNPIRVLCGERVRWVDRADDGEFAGWKWAVAPSGLEGWVPRAWFGAGDAQSSALRDYSAQELPIGAGEEVLELDEFSGWIWVMDRKGRCGWVPQDHVLTAR